MSAPLLWILVPLLAAAVLVVGRTERPVATWGALLAAALGLAGFVVPIDTPLVLGPLSLKVADSVQVLGRSFVLRSADGPLLGLIYGSAALWFYGAGAGPGARRVVPLGLAIVALLVASLAVDPFLFAAPLIAIASLLAVPLCTPPGTKPGPGVLRFLTYQTLGLPFILFAGWMLAGVEASPSDIAMTTQAGVMLGLGFAFLLAVFPLYSWIPMLAEDAPSFVAGFIFWLLPVFSIVFALGFMDRYAWLRSAPQLSQGVAAAGALMIATGGLFTAFERHLGRLMAFSAVAATGLAVVAMSLGSAQSPQLVFLLLMPRGIELALWSLSLATIAARVRSLRFEDVTGMARGLPVATLGLVIASLSMLGLPLLAGFPARLALLQALTRLPTGFEGLLLIGLLGVAIGTLRGIAALVAGREVAPPQTAESGQERVLIALGVVALIVAGAFPQVWQPILSALPRMFEHLAA